MVLPATGRTDNFLDAKRLAKLPRKCVIVNIGRGNSIDEKSLVEALKAGRIAGAYLDVIKDEPSSGLQPGEDGVRSAIAADKEGWSKNLVVMPHSSAFAPDYLLNCFRELNDDGVL
jgi:phosphoglycerate dehydrogenase-like enzyme